MRLKHFLSVFLTLLTLSVGQMWAVDPSVTINVTSDHSSWTAEGASSPGGTTTVVKSGITISSTGGLLSTDHVREFTNSVITISSSVGNIKSIAFTCKGSGTAQYGSAKLSKNSSTDAGTYEYSGYVGTWSFGTGTSNVSSVQLKATAQCRWTQVVVTYVGSDCSKPTVGSSLSSVSSTENSITATVPISATGGCNITENGLVYSTTASTPTVGGSGCIKETVTACGATAANKSVTISGLNCGTNYYVRGYATNSSGTSYTNVTTRSTSDCPKYTVTLMDDDTELEQATAGASVNLPTRDGCTGYTFAGWTKTWVAPQSSWTTTAPTIIPAGNYTPTNNENLYPVYTKTEEGGGTAFARYEKVTSAPSDWSGKYLLSTGTYTATGGYASKHLSCTSFTPGTTENTDYEFVLTKVGTTGYSIKFPGNSTSYLGYSSNTDFATSTSTPTSSSSSYLWTPSTTNISNVGSASRKLSTKADNTDIRPYENVPSGGALICLYKRIEEDASTTYYISIPNCCTPLAQINGSVSVTNQTVSWSAVTDASGYKVKVGTGDWSDIGNVTSKTFDLPCGGDTYNVYVMAYNNNNPGHCTGDGPASSAIQVTSTACTEPAITVDPNALTGLNYIVNAGPSTAQYFNVTGSNLTGALTVKANDNYEICLTNSATAADWKSGATTLSIAQATAEANAGQNVYVRLKSGKAVGDYNSNTIKVYGGGIEEASAVNVTVSGSVLKPTITADPTSISGWNTQTGSAPSPATKTITVTGVNLKADISASLTAGDDYFTITPSGLTPTSGSVNNGSVVISVKAATYATAGTYNGTLRLSTTDGDNADVTFSLTVTDDPREKFTLLTSSNVGEIGDGTRIVIVESDRTYAMNRTQDETNGHGYIGSTNQFSFQSENTIITLEVSNSVEILTLEEISDGVYALKTESTSKYLKWNGGTYKKFSEIASYEDEANALWTVDVDGDGHTQISANSGVGYYIGYNNTPSMTSRFRAYSDNSTYPIFAYFKASTTPKVNISGTLDAFTYMRDQGPSAAQSFKVRGNNLSENLVVTAPTNYEVCKTTDGSYTASVEFTPSEGKVAETDVYIRLKASLAINSYNGDITVSSTGATSKTLAVTGSVTTPVYTVTLNTNGGTINAGNVTEYTEGVGATLPSDVTKSGNSFNGWFDNEGLSGSAVTTIGTNATGNKEYWAKWTELPGYDITWLVDGEAYTGGEPDVHVVYNGSISKLPSTPTSLDITSKTFVGWTTDPVNEKQVSAPSPLYTAASQIPGNITENKIFYAVFAQETYSGTFTKVTSDATLAAGNRLLIYSNSYAAGTIGDNAFLSRESVAFTNDDITNKGNAAVWVLGGSTGEWTLTSDEGTLKCYGKGNNNLSMSSGTGTWEITITSGNATIKPTNLETYIKYNSAGRFSSYASGQSAVQLYREGTSLNDYTTKFVKPVAVTGVTLNKNATTLAIGGTETLTATVAPANATNKNVSWTTSAPGVATVEAGVVTAVADGEATITVTTEDGEFTDECVVTVLPTVETPTFSPAAGAINKGSKVEISCGTADATILYSLDGSDPSVAYPEGGVAINANCTLKAKATKTNYTPSAVAQAAYTIIKASQTVSFAESAISFRLESDEYEAFTGQTASSTYGSAVITYASSNTSVAEVNTNTGVVTLKGVKGTTTITATAAEDEDYASNYATYTITVLRAGKTRTGDFQLVTNANQLADGDYILLTSETSSYGSTAEVFSDVTSSGGTHQSKTVANDEITYSQLLAEGNTAKIIYLEKVTVGNIDYWAFNYGTESDVYIQGTSSTKSAGLESANSTSENYVLWSIVIGDGNVANVTNKDNSSRGTLCYNSSGNVGYFKAYASLAANCSMRIYKQKDKNKLPQTLSFATASYEFPLNESAYTNFSHQTVSGNQTAVTYTSSNAEVAAIVENTVVLQGGVGTTTITATAAEDDDYEHASATYTITVTAALNTVTFHYYKAIDATADQTALKEASSGAGITVPANPANVGEYTFIGWAPATLAETQTAPDNLVALQAGATYHPATSEEYHAIYRRLENSDGRFYLMHEVSSTPNYAKAPVGDEFGNTTDIAEAAKFVQTEDNKLYYYNGSTPTYIAGTHQGSGSTGRALDFTTDEAEALVWTITENGQIVSYYDSSTEKYFAHNNTMWAGYASSSITQDNQSKDLKKVYLAHVYYSSTPNLMVSPVLTWAQGNETHVMEIEATYDNAATATVNDVPVSVTYSSSDETKATVDNAGVVTAHLGGLVTITATVAENPGVSRQLVEIYQVSITKKVPQIVFNDGANWVVYVGEAYKRVLADNVEVTTDGAITYTLSNNATSSDYASINTNTGEVTGLYSNGSAIQAFWVHTEETDMYQAGAANHQFQVWSLKPQTLTFDQAAYAFEMNESVAAFTNTLSGAQTTVTYISDNTDVAEIDSESGEVTVHTNVCGTATITATAAEGQAGELIYREVSQTYTITVNYPMPTFSMESSNIKAPVSLTISGYDENTKLYWTNGNEDPETLYSAPLAISTTKTIRAKATNADGSLVSPIASVTLTKVTPTVVGSQEGGTITLSSDANSLITYIIENGNHVTVAEGTDVSTPVVFETDMSGTYTVLASAKWDVENGFVGENYLEEFEIKGKGHLPISYNGNGNGLADEAWASIVGSLGSYGNDPKIQFKNEGCALIAAFVEQPVQLSYDIKHMAANTNAWETTSNVYSVQWSADGETYNDIVVYNASHPISKDEITSESFELNPSARYIKWTYNTKTQSTGGNVALGNIRITCEAVVIDGVSIVDIPEGYDGDVVVEEGAKWIPVNNDFTPVVNNLWVKQGAVVDLSMATLEVNDLRIEAMEGYSGQILDQDYFSITGNAYYDLTLNTSGTMDNSKWYAFAVPFQVDAATGIQRLSNKGVASNAGFNSHYVLLKYNSAAYASAGQGWEYVTRGETLMPGKFYMIALNSNEYNRVRMTKKAGSPVNNKANLTLSTVGTGIHANWNALANNALAYANVNADGANASLKVQVYNSAEDSYTAYDFNKVTFTVGTPFFIQVAEAGTMNVDIAATYNETVKAPAREAVATGEFQIRLGANTESYYDILYVSASDEALNEYQIGHDLAKSGVSTIVPQMYVPAYGAKLCDAEFPLVNNEATFPLTFTAPSAGTYQLYLADAPENANLYLQHNGTIVWDLTQSPYEIELPQGTTEGYGLLLVQKMPMTPTGVEEPTSDSSLKGRATKVVIDEHVYILRGGQMYDVTGKIVK